MKIVEKTVYAFGELSESAKEKARDSYRDVNLDHGWHELILDYAKKTASILGIFINDINFSGFYSAGDGASFSGSYRYEKGGLKKIKEHAPLDHAPLDKELHKITLNLQKLQKVNFFQLRADITKSRRYSHSGTMTASVWREDGKDFDDDTECELLSLMQNFADWIYSRLQNEYDWLTSDEVIDEFIISNEFNFYEDGSIYHG